MNKIIVIMLSLVCSMSCASHKKAHNIPKTLVLYYSQTGATKAVAMEIQKQLSAANIESLEVENPYDGDFQATIARCLNEKSAGILPVLKPIKSKIEDYDIIFLGFPVWFGTYAPPIASLLKAEKFIGKKVVTFCTFGSGGLQSSSKDVVEALPEAQVVEGYGVRNARLAAISNEVNRFLIEGGFKEGEVEALHPFGTHSPVTPAHVEVFNQACGDYQFPLGTPIDVAIRETSDSVDYEYYVKSVDASGKDVMATIYVTVSKAEGGAKPEFTQVVR